MAFIRLCYSADLSLIPSEMESLCTSALSAILETPLSPSGLQQQLQQAADKLMGDLLLQCKADALDFQLRKTGETQLTLISVLLIVIVITIVSLPMLVHFLLT